jgi:hypothetical protein
MKRIFKLLLACLIFLYSTDIIKANQVIYSESFDNPDVINDWNVLQNQGDNNWGVCLDNAGPAHWQIKNNWIGIILDGTSCTTVISPTNLDLTDQNNYIFEFDWKFDESIDMDRNVVFLWQDQNNWYGLKQYGTGLHLEKVVDGIVRSLPNSQITYPFQNDQTYHFLIQYLDQQTITIKIDDQIVIETTDSNPIINGYKTIALKTALGGGRSVSFFDNLIVKTLGEVQGTEDNSETKLDVIQFRQDNFQWAELEYDHASEWSEKKTTIKRWGCALSSMTMILNYYGINQFPNGEPINPETLNSWLKLQPDGYIGEGLLNWLAVTRLTKQISDLFDTPKLEYSVVTGDLLLPTIEQINLLRPTILNIMGHFLIGNGFIKDFSDLLIIDPIYPYSYFSDHQTELISTRIFTPSQTDLSYILLTTNPNTNVVIKNQNGQIVKTTQLIETLVSHDENKIEQEIKQYKIVQVAKPTSQTYNLSFSSEDDQSISFNLYSYDQEGTVSQFEENNLFSGETHYNFNYKKEVLTQTPEENSNTLTKVVTWESLIETVEQIAINNNTEKYITDYLIKIINWAKVETITNQLRYVTLLNNYLNKVDIDKEINQELIENLNSINLI